MLSSMLESIGSRLVMSPWPRARCRVIGSAELLARAALPIPPADPASTTITAAAATSRLFLMRSPSWFVVPSGDTSRRFERSRYGDDALGRVGADLHAGRRGGPR